MFDSWWWWLPLVAAALWWLAGRPGWPRRRGGVGAPTLRPDIPTPVVDDGRSRAPPLVPVPADEDASAAAAAAAEAALQEAQASARRELAAREAAEREAAARAAAQAAAEREAAARTAAERQAAEAAARREAERLAADARRRAAAWQAERERAAEAAAAEAAAAAPVAPAPAEHRLAEQTLVMVADDSKVVRVKTSRLLAAHRFRVVLAEDGTQALALIGQQTPQVLITDVEMPGLDGLALTRALRADPRTAGLPVVMITSADDRLRDAAAAAGVTVLMGKPYAEQDLVAQVARLAGVTLPG